MINPYLFKEKLATSRGFFHCKKIPNQELWNSLPPTYKDDDQLDFLRVLENQPPIIIPIPSMHGIFTYILPYSTVKKQPNVGKYTGHMDS